jgi:ribosomal protein S18 acetylase RimI-like enzyme
MAARTEAAQSASPPLVTDLRHVSARQMEPLLSEESAAWSESLDWDFEKSADLVRRFVDMHALNGYALVEQGRAVGYTYFVLEDHKGLIGDLYLSRRRRATAFADLLLGNILETLVATAGVNRIESQLMMLDPRPARELPMASRASMYERLYMRADLAEASLGEGKLRRRVFLERWSDHYQDPAAQLIATAYSGHVDSLINDQYRTTPGARKFLHNIVQYPGCGTFYRPASFAAFDAATGKLCGISLASLVAPGAGHITQICVAPGVRGTGVGHRLLHQSMTTLKQVGCRTASLTVTASNAEAVGLYRRVGFETIRTFGAYVWEGF